MPINSDGDGPSYRVRFFGVDAWISERTVRLAEQLHHLAVSGDCVGFAFAAIMKGGRYARGYTGVVTKQPEVTVGILQRVISDLILQAERNSMTPPPPDTHIHK